MNLLPYISAGQTYKMSLQDGVLLGNPFPCFSVSRSCLLMAPSLTLILWPPSFNVHCDYIGPTQKNPRNLPFSRAL